MTTEQKRNLRWFFLRTAIKCSIIAKKPNESKSEILIFTGLRNKYAGYYYNKLSTRSALKLFMIRSNKN